MRKALSSFSGLFGSKKSKKHSDGSAEERVGLLADTDAGDDEAKEHGLGAEALAGVEYQRLPDADQTAPKGGYKPMRR